MISVLDLIFPKFCVNCGKIGSYICASCEKTIQPIWLSDTICPMCQKSAIDGRTHPYCRTRYALDGLISFYHYRGAIKKAIKNIKYQFVSDITTSLVLKTAELEYLPDIYPWLTDATVVPIPLHVSRHKYRGFNQAELFAQHLAKFYNLPFRRDMIRRTKVSLPQVEMKTKKQRLLNMKDMFFVEYDAVPKKIILIDDVFTTGATMREAGRVLKQQGAQVVWAVSLAR